MREGGGGLNQRWRHHRSSYRPAGEPINPRHYEVAAIADDTTAKVFVCAHHYSATFPAARFRFGLYKIGARDAGTNGIHRSQAVRMHHLGIAGRSAERVTSNKQRQNDGGTCAGRLHDRESHDGDRAEAVGTVHTQQLVGVAVFSVPCNDATLTNVFPCAAMEATELGRFVLLNSVPGNGETWFLARCFEQLRREGIAGVVSFSDPCGRTTLDDALIFPGHVGFIYQAHNGIYLGRGRARRLRILPDGTALSDRAIAKLLARHRGWESVARRLQSFGADEIGADVRAWATRWIAKLTRPLRHCGNHKYAWGLTSSMRKHLPTSLAFPKQVDPFGEMGVGGVRLTNADTLQEALAKIVEGNPGAINACLEMIKIAKDVDPDSAFEEWTPVLDFDQHGIYGSQIWILFKDVCGQNAARVLAIFRAVQLGQLNWAAVAAAMNRESTLDFESLVSGVRKDLPNFDRQNLTGVAV